MGGRKEVDEISFKMSTMRPQAYLSPNALLGTDTYLNSGHDSLSSGGGQHPDPHAVYPECGSHPFWSIPYCSHSPHPSRAPNLYELAADLHGVQAPVAQVKPRFSYAVHENVALPLETAHKQEGGG